MRRYVFSVTCIDSMPQGMASYFMRCIKYTSFHGTSFRSSLNPPVFQIMKSGGVRWAGHAQPKPGCTRPAPTKYNIFNNLRVLGVLRVVLFPHPPTITGCLLTLSPAQYIINYHRNCPISVVTGFQRTLRVKLILTNHRPSTGKIYSEGA